MKVTGFELFKVPPRWLFLKIETDEGISGWGEPVLEGKADTVSACVDEMMDCVVGKDPRRIEDIFQTLYRGAFYRGGLVLMSAISGIDQALWDIKARALGLPVHELIGGRVRDKVQVYMGLGGNAETIGKAAQERYDQGYRVVKMGAEPMAFVDSHRAVDNIAEQVCAIRETMGDKLDIAIDFHGRVHKGMAKTLIHALNPFDMFFVEEPVLPEYAEVFPELARIAQMPLATGERVGGRWGYKEVLSRGGMDILQPDLSHAGGLWECHKIAAMAEAYDVAIAPHCPLGPIALAACLQLDFCTPNAFIQEQSLGVHAPDGPFMNYIKTPGFTYEAGYVTATDAPGLGIEVDEDKVREAAKTGHRWRNPVLRGQDGVIVEW